MNSSYLLICGWVCGMPFALLVCYIIATMTISSRVRDKINFTSEEKQALFKHLLKRKIYSDWYRAMVITVAWPMFALFVGAAVVVSAASRIFNWVIDATTKAMYK
jgi:hypothetical protein